MTPPTGRSTRLANAVNLLSDLTNRLEAGRASRDDFDLVIAELVGTQYDYFGPRPRAARGDGAKGKILAYLMGRLGEPVYGEQIRAVSGIQEWPRRVRELRVQDGFEIVELGSSIYRLESATPDLARATQWQLANAIRTSGGSALERIARFFEANVGQVLTRKQLDYVADIPEGARRIRELRDERGLPILSHIDDRSLKPGEYRLLSRDRRDLLDPSQRLYSQTLRQKVFERDDYTCRVCGRNREKALAAGDTRFYLEVHHRIAVADDLERLSATELNDMNNLVTLCHADHLRETAALQRQKRHRRRA
jgi:5-methylcytosine-specific restriction endonuclease McrA